MVTFTNKAKGAGYRAFLVSRNVEETLEIGEILGELLRGGEVLLLDGTLGSGKTWLCHGIAKSLQVADPVQSPTFTLLCEHSPLEGGRELWFYHFDAYRLTDEQEWYDLGFDEYINGKGVTAVEWASRVQKAMPTQAIRLTFQPGSTEGERRIELDLPDDFPSQRLEEWNRKLKPYGLEEKE